MRSNKPARLDKKHPAAARDAMEDSKDVIRYMEPNRDRALGSNDRTGRHFDAENRPDTDEGSAASKEHEAD